MKHVEFAHLQVHSQYSLLQAMCRIPQIVSRVYDLKMPAVAITDFGNMFGAIDFYKEAMKKG